MGGGVRKFSNIKAAAAAMCICSESGQKPRDPLLLACCCCWTGGSDPRSLALQVLTAESALSGGGGGRGGGGRERAQREGSVLTVMRGGE